MSNCIRMTSVLAVVSLLLLSSAFAVEVKPFVFTGVASEDHAQQEEWQNLMKYKLWGTEGIIFTDEGEVRLEETSGYNGTAKGDVAVGHDYHIGGPFTIGGNFNLTHFGGEFFKGPVRVLGNMNVPGWELMSDLGAKSRFDGPYCVRGSVTGPTAGNDNTVETLKGMTSGGFYENGDYTNCPSEVPPVDTLLSIPFVDFSNVTWHKGISVTTYTDSEIQFIHVPPQGQCSDVGDCQYGTYDLYIDDIRLVARPHFRLYVVMPKNGRLTRIFVRDGLNIDNSASGKRIQVVYAENDSHYSDGKWDIVSNSIYGDDANFLPDSLYNVNTLHYSYVEDKYYGGNLLFYTTKPIDWNSSAAPHFQGTFISADTVSIGNSFAIAGQVLARYIKIRAPFASDFKYVPFDPPVVVMNSNAFVYEEHEKLGDTVQLVLDTVPPTEVQFKYCFKFYEDYKRRGYASIDDLVENGNGDIPLCSNGDTLKASFKKGETSLTTPIILHAIDDKRDEGGYEQIDLMVCDLEAAVFEDGDREGKCNRFKIRVVDGVSMTPDTAFSVVENAKAKDTLGSVMEAGASSGNTFVMVDPEGVFDVDAKGTVFVKADNSINYEMKNLYDIKVLRYDGSTLLDSVSIHVNVIDVNEPPFIQNATFQIFENAAADFAVGVLPYFDEDEEESGFRKNSFSLVGGDSAFFSIDAATGKISAKKTFDYEALPADKKFYTVKVKISDPDGYSSTADVKIEILDVMEKSEIVVTLVESDNGDTKVEKPTTTVNMNVNSGVISWTADGKTMPDTVLTNLHEGKNVITLSYRDSTRNEPVTKDVVIFVCTKTPSVMMSTDSNNVTASNIYTIVEKIEEGDTSFYVNKTKKDLVIEIKEPILDSTYTDSTCNYKTTPVKISVDLDTLKTSPSAAVKDLGAIANKKVALNESAAGATHTLYNDSLILVTYKDKIDGKDVVVSYLTNSKGDLVEDNFKVAYETTVDGKTVTVSYEADAATGEPVKNKDGVLFEVSTKKDGVTVAYQVDASGKVIKDANNNVGYTVTFSYKTEFGNEASKSIYVVVDKVGPKVEIKSPVDNQVIHSNMVEVEWYVDYGDGKGPQLQKDLVTQGLTKGPNVIVRYYKDKAGNEAADTVFVIMKDAKDVDISVETPVTIITKDKVAEYYAANELKKGQTYAVTIYNSKFDKEVETLTGGSYKPKPGSGNEPYPGLEGHLGPTLAVDVKVPSINALGGLATLDDMMDENGMVLLEDVDAGKKATVEDYVKEYCSADFATSFNSDPARANLYKTTMEVKIWVFTSLGSFVDYFTFKQELDNPDYANDAGLLTLYFEQKPDKNGDVRTKDGRLYGTGAYVYKTEVTLRSKLQCTLYPASGSPEEKGRVRKTTDDLLKPFGYKRPQDK